MERNPFIKPLGWIAGVLGFIEGLAWMIMCVAGILIKLLEVTPDCTDQTYGFLIICEIYEIYFSDLDSNNSFFIIHNSNFIIVMVISGALSFAWFCISSCIIIALAKRNCKNLKMKFVTWASIAGTITLFDLIMTILLFLDYNEGMNKANETKLPTLLIPMILAVGVVLIVCAKGFVLWVVNAILVYIITRVARNFEKSDYNTVHSHVL